MINNFMNVSFKGYIPVSYYAKSSDSGNYDRVINYDNLKKCHGIIVRNLNGTLKNDKWDSFVDLYKRYDSDYKSNSKVCSIYDKDTPDIILVTGCDVDKVKEMAKPVGIAKSDSIDKIGSSKSFESSIAAKQYFSNVKSFLKNSCQRIKDKDGNNLSLYVYLDPKYKKTGELKGFKPTNAEFIKEEKK